MHSSENPVELPAALAERPSIWVVSILSLLMGFASISTDFYLPALPQMTKEFHAHSGMLGLTISSYLIGFSIGQLFWGPIGDRYGRRMPIAAGLVLFIIGSAGCALSHTVTEIIVWRIIQALGGCAGVVLARAMVRDLYQGDRAAQMLSTLMSVMAIAPLLGPILGGQILAFAGWQAIFWTLALVGLFSLVALCSIPETLPPERRRMLNVLGIIADYGGLLKNPRLMWYIGAGCFYYGGTFAYIAGSPFAYVGYYHVSAQWYGILFSFGIVGIMLLNVLNASLVRSRGSTTLLQAGAWCAALAGIVLAVDARTGWAGLVGLVMPLFLFVTAFGLIVANSIAGALNSYPQKAGTVSALLGSMQYGSGIISSALVSIVADGTPWPMGWVVAIGGIGTLVCACFAGAEARNNH